MAYHRILIDPHTYSALHGLLMPTLSAYRKSAQIFSFFALNDVTTLLHSFSKITGKISPKLSSSTTTYHRIINMGQPLSLPAKRLVSDRLRAKVSIR